MMLQEGVRQTLTTQVLTQALMRQCTRWLGQAGCSNEGQVTKACGLALPHHCIAPAAVRCPSGIKTDSPA